MEVAIITGASKGLGRALAEGLAEAGWSLVIDARDESSLEEAARALRQRLLDGASLISVRGDVTSESHRAALVEAAASIGGLDLLVNNASDLGTTPLPHLEDYPLDSLRNVLEVDLVAPLALVQRAIGLLGGSVNPRIINITSDASVEHYEGWGAYGLAKAALDHLSATLAEEHRSLRVWAVDPGDLRTDMHQAAFPGEDISDRPLPESVVPIFIELVRGDMPSGRYKATEIATTYDESSVRAAI
jgi:NAD(P)-dependent dehydrogenase (short-subunit alcohol dehydrogenase family)